MPKSLICHNSDLFNSDLFNSGFGLLHHAFSMGRYITCFALSGVHGLTFAKRELPPKTGYRPNG